MVYTVLELLWSWLCFGLSLSWLFVEQLLKSLWSLLVEGFTRMAVIPVLCWLGISMMQDGR